MGVNETKAARMQAMQHYWTCFQLPNSFPIALQIDAWIAVLAVGDNIPNEWSHAVRRQPWLASRSSGKDNTLGSVDQSAIAIGYFLSSVLPHRWLEQAGKLVGLARNHSEPGAGRYVGEHPNTPTVDQLYEIRLCIHRRHLQWWDMPPRPHDLIIPYTYLQISQLPLIHRHSVRQPVPVSLSVCCWPWEDQLCWQISWTLRCWLADL